MYEYDVSKSNMWREVHEQPEIIRHVIDVNLPIIENICKEVDNRNISKVLLWKSRFVRCFDNRSLSMW